MQAISFKFSLMFWVISILAFLLIAYEAIQIVKCKIIKRKSDY